MLRSNRKGNGGVHSALFRSSSHKNHSLVMDEQDGKLGPGLLPLTTAGLVHSGSTSTSTITSSIHDPGSPYSGTPNVNGLPSAQPTRRKKATSKTIARASLTSVVGLVLLVKLFLVCIGKSSTRTDTTLLVNNANSGFHSNSHHRRAVEQIRSSIPSAWWDVAIVGAGPAGLTAALFAARAGLSVLVLGSSSTGQLAETASLDNFPGFVVAGLPEDAVGGGAGGAAWLAITQGQAGAAGVKFAQAGLRVAQILRFNDDDEHDNGNLFLLQLESNHHEYPNIPTRSIVIATGSQARRLDLPLETQLWGKHVHSCAICDGSIYANKSVVVVGGGDAAVDAALLLARHAASVTLVHRRTTFRASNQRNLQLLHQQQERIHIQTPYTVQEYVVDLDTNQQLTGVRIQNVDHPEQTTEVIPCDGLFVMIGSTPNTQFLAARQGQQASDPNLVHVDLSEDGLIRLSPNNKINAGGMQTTTTMSSVPGIFAAGEVTDSVYKQAITAAAAGAQAAIDAERWLREQSNDASGSTAATQRRSVPDNIPLQEFQTTAMTTTINAKKAPAKKAIAKELSANDSSNCDLATEACITALVNKHPVVVFSKPYCPYCKKALEAMSLEGVAEEPYLKVVNLLGNGMSATQAKAIQTTLGRMTGGRVTVPNVFVGGTSIGGGDETYALHRRGELRQLLRDAQAYPPPTECNLAAEDCLRAIIAKFPVVVFSKNYCPHCKKSIELFDMEGVKGINNLHVIDLMQYENYSDIQDTLAKMTKRRTVPNIFVGGRNLGGTTEVEGMQLRGELRGYLAQAKAFA